MSNSVSDFWRDMICIMGSMVLNPRYAYCFRLLRLSLRRMGYCLTMKCSGMAMVWNSIAICQSWILYGKCCSST